MLLFSDNSIKNAIGKDDTIDPAYFARKVNSSNSSESGDVDSETIKNLQVTINNLQNTINEISQKIEELEQKDVHIELTQEEYDALDEKDENIEYFISKKEEEKEEE